ncbi:hypothetical protein MALU111345_14720 [Marinicrinis lubricantis]
MEALGENENLFFLKGIIFESFMLLAFLTMDIISNNAKQCEEWGMTMSRYEFMARNQDDTEHLARALAERLPSGSVVALDGDLGAGKTTFSKAFGKAMGVEGIINSPTFTIIKEYEGRTRPFFHMDVYRISPAEAEDLGLDEYFYGEGITLVEWAKLIEELLPEERLHITIEHGEGDQRQFRMEPVGKRYEEVCAQLEDLEGWKL